MRRYSNIRYGGFGNNFPARINTDATMPEHRIGEPPILPTPPDLLPRSPGKLGESPPHEPTQQELNIERIAEIFARRLERSIVPNYDGLRLARFQTQFFSLTGGNVTLVLPQPTTKRVYLRMGPVSALFFGGTVYIGFDTPPLQAQSLSFNTAGTAIEYIEWIYTVPQNAIFLANAPTEINPVNIYVTSAEQEPRAANDLRDHSGPRR